jgi:phosphate starvation-inducible PhoH-like protein
MAKQPSKKQSIKEQEGRQLAITKRIANEDKIMRDSFMDFKKVKLTESQYEFYNKIHTNIITFGTGPAGTAKAQPLYSKVLTPTGWCNIGDIKVNDTIWGHNGEKCTVLGVYPQGLKEVYEIEFSDGTVTQSCGEHLWTMWDGEFWKTLQLNKIFLDYEKYQLPIFYPIRWDQDSEIVIPPFKLAKLILKALENSEKSIPELVELGISDISIPENYFKAPVALRKELINNLFNGSDLFETTNTLLLNQITQMCRELGGVVKKTQYSVSGLIMNDKRTELLPGKSFVKITKLEEKQQCVCIKVTDPLSLYITDGYSLTHNTFTATYAALKMLKEGLVEKIIYCKPIIEVGEPIGFLPGTEDEKVAPHIELYKELMEEIILDPKDINTLWESGRISFKHIGYARGVTRNNAAIIIDEAQNMNARTLLTLITRMGKNSKVIITGDSQQHDIKKSQVALDKFVEMLQLIEGVEFHQFTSDDIVRHPILIEITKRYDEWMELGKF